MSHSTPSPSITIRPATAADSVALRHLAQLDTAPELAGRVLVAEVGGELWAAAEVDGDGMIADPFRRSGELLLLVAERAGQLRRAEARAVRRTLRRGLLRPRTA